MLSIMKENVEDLLRGNLWLALPAELISTLIITLLGCGAWSAGSIPLHVSLTFGLTTGTIVGIFHHISGGHANPAVTIASLFTRKVSIIRGVLYIIAQTVGGIIGAGILYGLAPEAERVDLGANQLQPNVSSSQGFGVELLTTFLYVLTVHSTQDEKRTDVQGSNPLTKGLAASVCHMFAIPYTRGGLNPARSFGPAIILGEWKDHWVFWVGPLVGAILAGLLYEYVFSAGATFAGVTKCLLTTKIPNTIPAPEKAVIEEVRNEIVDIEESKVDETKPPEAAAPEADKQHAVVAEVNEQDKK
uniref:Aquaporin n=1 Tax=Arion vulgaris TaxID=1028688 RepID=A0A0B7BDU9_9EUPU